MRYGLGVIRGHRTVEGQLLEEQTILTAAPLNTDLAIRSTKCWPSKSYPQRSALVWFLATILNWMETHDLALCNFLDERTHTVVLLFSSLF